MPKALIATIIPISGGVPQMAAFVSDLLKNAGYDTSFAYYQPYSLTPDLSAPLHRMASKRVGTLHSRYHGCRARAIGAWLPELEFTHYLPTHHWREVMDQHDVHLSVSGNCLAATPFALSAIPFWSWVATDWAEDRVERAGEYPWYRKTLDRLITTVGAKKLEKKIMASGGTIVALSEYTRRVLSNSIRKPLEIDVMPMGIDTNKFRQFPRQSSKVRTVGFVGRLDDPRKNVDLLLDALALCREKMKQVTAILVGEGRRQDLKRKLDTRGLGEVVTIVDYIENGRLPDFLSKMDVFVVPSHQEGLCIAALEAMSCNVPVISTRCGGPEEFVIDDKTGYLVDHNAECLAAAIVKMLSVSELRNDLGDNARDLVVKSYSMAHVKDLFWSSFCSTFFTDAGRNPSRRTSLNG